eukprot:268238_1
MANDFNPLDYITQKIEFENGNHGWIASYTSNNSQFICKTWQRQTFELSLKQVQTAIARYNNSRNAVPKSELNQQAEIDFNDKTNDKSVIKPCELEWMISHQPLNYNPKQIQIDLGEEEAVLLFNAINTFTAMYKNTFNKDIFGALAWNGVVSRWRLFMAFLETQFTSANAEEKKESNTIPPADAQEALLKFGESLGRVVSYRALALTKEQYDSIVFLNEIVPTGQLRASLKEMQEIVNTHGITRITVARLYISHLSEWIGLDPSLSLHDDCETALCISQTYMSEAAKKYVYLFEMDVPKVMCIGWKVVDVQRKRYLVDGKRPKASRQTAKQKDRWFGHNGVWFDANQERTERQLLYCIPFLKQRCNKIEIFRTEKELLKRIEPFKHSQQKLKDESETLKT